MGSGDRMILDEQELEWKDSIDLNPRKFKCYYCDSEVASDKGYVRLIKKEYKPVADMGLLICPNCRNVTSFSQKDGQFPLPRYGADVKSLPTADIKQLYKESRDCIGVKAYTASIMCSRKLLMNIAVVKGAKENDSFKSYVDYIIENRYFPVESKSWIDQIRRLGNEATHEIKVGLEVEAKALVDFIEMILRVLFEYPNKIVKASKNNNSKEEN